MVNVLGCAGKVSTCYIKAVDQADWPIKALPIYSYTKEIIKNSWGNNSSSIEL